MYFIQLRLNEIMKNRTVTVHLTFNNRIRTWIVLDFFTHRVSVYGAVTLRFKELGQGWGFLGQSSSALTEATVSMSG